MPIPATYRIRPMRPADVAAVIAIEEQVKPNPWTASGYQHELAGNELAHYVVLCHDEAVVGYGGYWLVADEAQISIIATHPRWRGQGLGERLLLHMLAQAASLGATLVTLEVRRSNGAALGLYHKVGFVVVGERRGYYKDTQEDALQEDALLMNLEPLSAAAVQGQLAAWQAARPGTTVIRAA